MDESQANAWEDQEKNIELLSLPLEKIQGNEGLRGFEFTARNSERRNSFDNFERVEFILTNNVPQFLNI